MLADTCHLISGNLIIFSKLSADKLRMPAQQEAGVVNCNSKMIIND